MSNAIRQALTARAAFKPSSMLDRTGQPFKGQYQAKSNEAISVGRTITGLWELRRYGLHASYHVSMLAAMQEAVELGIA